MKPTLKISIGNTAFNIEEDAYNLLKKYLDRLNAHYANLSSGKEIIEDIELRIAELLSERIGSPEQPVSENIIKEVIDILGFPEEMEANEKQSETEFSEPKTKNVQKKLYRDTHNKVLGGVCSGLANYFNMDVVLIRVLFVVFFIGFSALHFFTFGITSGTIILIYLILWIVTPQARTVQQRYEMHGEKPNVKNIQQKVEKELREAGESIKKHSPVAAEIVRVLGRIIFIFAGSLAIIIAVSVLMAFILAFGFGFTTIHTVLADLLDFVNISWRPEWFFSLLAALIFLPFIGLLYSGIKALFNLKTKLRVGLIILLLWIASLFTLIGMSIYHAKDYMHWRTVHEYVELPFAHYDTLYVDIPQKYYQEGTLESVIDRVNDWKIVQKYEKKQLKHKKRGTKNKKYNDVHIVHIECDDFSSNAALFFYKKDKKANETLLLFPAMDSRISKKEQHFGIDIYKDAAGRNLRSAYHHAQDLSFNYTLKDSLLILEPLSYTKNNQWDGELIRLHFNVPEGKTIVFGKAFTNTGKDPMRVCGKYPAGI
jgi:phage shock protein PspC (stress-responsive transcriptional regulator)